VPRLDARQDGLEAVTSQPLDMWLGEEGEAALRHEIDRTRGSRRFDGIQHLIEPDPKVGVVPADARPAQLTSQELEVEPQQLQLERRIRQQRERAHGQAHGTYEVRKTERRAREDMTGVD